MRTVHVLVPEGIDDPQRPSGGNVYDRHLCRELTALGWSVHEYAVTGAWPHPGTTDLTALAEIVAGIPDGSVVLVDGLVAQPTPAALVSAARRLRLVVLAHMEGQLLPGGAAVVTSSGWTRGRLLEMHDLAPDRVHVAEPGVDPADLAPGTADGGELLCVAAVAPHKGHDVLLTALSTITDLPWRYTCVGSLDRDPGFVDTIRRQARADRIGDRVRFTGPLTGPELDAAYAGSDVLVLASRGESYGMVATEALARGLPVIATAVGGVPHAVGRDAAGRPPGLLVPPDDPEALAEALRTWLGDADLRRSLRQSAAQRRATLPGWSATVRQVSRVLAELA